MIRDPDSPASFDLVAAAFGCHQPGRYRGAARVMELSVCSNEWQVRESGVQYHKRVRERKLSLGSSKNMRCLPEQCRNG